MEGMLFSQHINDIALIERCSKVGQRVLKRSFQQQSKMPRPYSASFCLASLYQSQRSAVWKKGAWPAMAEGHS